MPLPVGSVSERLAVVAIPAPLLVTATVNPIAVPADTLAASAVLVIERFGHCTTVDAADCTEALLAAETIAVFEYVAQLVDDVLLVRCTLAVPEPARFPKL